MVKLVIGAETTILSQCYMVHDKSYKDWPETELRAPRQNVGNEQPVLCMAILDLEFQSGSLRTLVAFVSYRQFRKGTVNRPPYFFSPLFPVRHWQSHCIPCWYLLKVLWAPGMVRGFAERKALASAGNQTKVRAVYSLVTTSITFIRFVNKYQFVD